MLDLTYLSEIVYQIQSFKWSLAKIYADVLTYFHKIHLLLMAWKHSTLY